MKPQRRGDNKTRGGVRARSLTVGVLLLAGLARAGAPGGAANAAPGAMPPAPEMDSNGLPVAWEMKYFGKTGLDPASSPSGNGFTLLEAYRHGLDPANYYSQLDESGHPTIIVPKITIVSGDQQIGGPGENVDQPLVIQVADSMGRRALPHAPVIFTVGAAGGSVATQPDKRGPSAAITADDDGQAKVYFQCPKKNGVSCTIRAGASGVSATFTEKTSSGDGSFDQPSDWTETCPRLGELDLTWVNHASLAKYILVEESTDRGQTWHRNRDPGSNRNEL
jgi:hypothetical protein